MKNRSRFGYGEVPTDNPVIGSPNASLCEIAPANIPGSDPAII